MSAGVAAIVPAKDEADRVAATVTALLSLDAVDLVVVVDDGSTDATAAVAADAEALVVRHPANRGKAAALETGVARLLEEETRIGSDAHVLLFADADLGVSAANLEPLLRPVLAGAADLAIANIPRSASSLGAGRVVRLARGQIEAMTGRTIEQPLNGMRALTRETFADATPLATGWGVEAAMLVDVLRAGRRVVEVPIELTHRRTGNDFAGRLHRAKQLRDVSTALLARRFLS
ncbi:MAG: glycosyltransferase [Janibacter sp.]|nr:glycosyltransferase [Janibacter sp.]